MIIKDYGPGLSPERILEVFTKYGESTKRCDENIKLDINNFIVEGYESSSLIYRTLALYPEKSFIEIEELVKEVQDYNNSWS